MLTTVFAGSFLSADSNTCTSNAECLHTDMLSDFISVLSSRGKTNQHFHILSSMNIIKYFNLVFLLLSFFSVLLHCYNNPMCYDWVNIADSSLHVVVRKRWKRKLLKQPALLGCSHKVVAADYIHSNAAPEWRFFFTRQSPLLSPFAPAGAHNWQTQQLLCPSQCSHFCKGWIQYSMCKINTCLISLLTLVDWKILLCCPKKNICISPAFAHFFFIFYFWHQNWLFWKAANFSFMM